jgi:uncharacterized repeat protein (TIGR03803 family)
MRRNEGWSIKSVTAGAAAALLLLHGVATTEPVFTVLHTFPAGVGSASLIQAIDGNFYGTTYDGGNTTACSNGCGMAYKMTPGGSVTILHTFVGGATDGAHAYSPLIQASDGNFYGTTVYGGGGGCTLEPGGCGTVFKMTPAGTVTILHAFMSGATDGASPLTALIQAIDGNFYGTTVEGGDTARCYYGCGVAFKMTPGGSVTILHAFVGGATDGFRPHAPLIQASDGNFYGTTTLGGNTTCGTFRFPNQDCGTAFRMTPSGTTTTLHAFAGVTDGYSPHGLIQARDGNFYGTTAWGGNVGCTSSVTFGCGTIFKMTSTGTVTILSSFSATDGFHSPDGLIQATDGNFYGTTYGGASPPHAGAVFKMTPAGTVTFPHSFTSCPPTGALVQATDHSFYGSTQACVPDNSTALIGSTVFRLSGLIGDDLAVDFGAASGLWMLFDGDTSHWTRLHTLSAKNIVTGEAAASTR